VELEGLEPATSWVRYGLVDFDPAAPSFADPTTDRHDEAIAPDAERMFAERMGAETVEAPSSHVAMVSNPDAVVELIDVPSWS
jgi:hypothetical protein